MNRVRHAGHLIKEEHHRSRSYWCVIRNGLFLAYASNNDATCDIEIGDEPARVFPISHLSATAFIIPQHKGPPTQFALELHCAKSNQHITFYADHQSALETWVDAIKAESNSDKLDFFDCNQGGILPPDIDVGSAGHLDENPADYSYDEDEFVGPKPTENNLKFASLFGKEQLVKENLFSTNNLESVRTKSPLKQNTNFEKSSSPSLSNTSSSFYQDSADESSVTSSPLMTSSPIRTSPMCLEKREKVLEQKSTQNLAIQNNYKKKEQLFDLKSSLNSSRDKNPYFYIREGPNHLTSSVKQKGKTNGPTSRIRKGKAMQSSPSKRSSRHTIAPISNLDLQINQRQRTNKPSFVPLISKQHHDTDSDDSDSDNSTEDENQTIEKSFQSESVNSILSDISSNTNSQIEENNNVPKTEFIKTEEIKTPVHKIKEKLKSNENLKKNGSFLKTQDEDQRKRSGSIGSRILNRAKSAVGKRNSRSIELPLEGDNNSDKDGSRDQEKSPKKNGSLDKDRTRNSTTDNTKSIPNPINSQTIAQDEISSPKENNERIVIKDGWLYRRKRMTWSRIWAVLEANKHLYFYKNDQVSMDVMPVSRFELLFGCEVVNVIQSKGNSTFVLNYFKQHVPDIMQSPLNTAQPNDLHSIQLMCKNTQEFIYWMKAFHLVNSTKGGVVPNQVIKPILTLRPINRNLNSSPENEKELLKKAENFEAEDSKSLPASGKKTKLSNNIPSYNTNNPKVGTNKDNTTPCNDTTLNSEITSPHQNKNGVKTFEETKMEFDFGFIDDVTNTSLGTRHRESRDFAVESNDFGTGGTNKVFHRFPIGVNNVISSDSIVNCRDFSISDAPENNTNLSTSLSTNCQLADTSNNTNLLRHNSSLSDQVNKEHVNNNNIKVILPRTRELDNCIHNRALNPDGLLRDKVIENSSQSQTSEPSVRSSEDSLLFSFRPRIQKQEKVEMSSLSCKSVVPQRHRARTKVKQVGDCIESVYNLQYTATDLLKNLKFGSTKTFDNPVDISQRSSINNFNLLKQFSCSRNIDALNLEIHFKNLTNENLFLTTDNKRNLNKTLLKKNIIWNKPFEKAELRRSASDSNLLESLKHRLYRMRNLNKRVPELSEIDFIEIYGLTQRNINTDNRITSSNINDNENIINKNRQTDSIKEAYLNKLSFGDESSEDSRHVRTNGSVASTTSSVTSSTGSGLSETSKKQASWFKNMTFSLKRATSSAEHGKKQTVLEIPAVQLSTSSHRGYLDLRNKKKQWERFFCVLQDACLYCYNTPQSQTTCDVILLRGYDVAAEVTNMNRSRFTFRLEQNGFQTIHLSTNNHEEFVFWVAALEQETRKVIDRNGNRTLEDDHVTKRTIDNNPTRKTWTKSLSNDEVEQQLVELQKHKLLQEIAAQQQTIMREQLLLETKESVRVNQQLENQRISRRDDVIEKFEQSRQEEVVKMIKYMTQLNTRRNSAQLKVDQLSKEIGPKSGKKRSKNHQHFAALESRLNSMKQRLSEIDLEIREQQETKLNNFEKIRERQELELLVTEQQESLDILKNNRSHVAPRKRHQLTARSSRDHLTSIEELSSISDCSGSSGSLEVGRIRQAMSTPRQMRRSPPFEVNSSDSLPSIELLRPNLTRSEDDLSSLRHNSLSDVIASSSMTRGDSKSSLPCEKSTNNEIDPDVLAGIEMFELFSKHTLAKVSKKL